MKIHLFLFQLTTALLLIFVFPVYFAMSADSNTGTSNNDPCNAQVSIYKFKFIPQEITIKAGTRIRWTNNEKRQYHSVWFEKLGEPEPEYFFPDEIYERTFTKTGTFPYRCGPHPKMTGIVHVK